MNEQEVEARLNEMNCRIANSDERGYYFVYMTETGERVSLWITDKE